MNKSTAFAMIAMAAANSTEEELIDKVISELTEYKILSKDELPIQGVIMLMHKFHQRGKSFVEIMKEIQEDITAITAFDNLMPNDKSLN